jgi:Family of unknown function (DUF6516)
MRHNLLQDYLNAVELAISSLTNVYVEQYIEEILTAKRANLRIRLRFISGCLLELNEAIIVEADNLVSLDYRYHCQDVQNRLLFRYDNTPHFPALSSFPHHKHLPDDVIVSAKPTIFHVIKESELLSRLDGDK